MDRWRGLLLCRRRVLGGFKQTLVRLYQAQLPLPTPFYLFIKYNEMDSTLRMMMLPWNLKGPHLKKATNHRIDNGQWVRWGVRGPSFSYHCVTSPYQSGRPGAGVSVCDKCITRPSANYTSGQTRSTGAYEQKTFTCPYAMHSMHDVDKLSLVFCLNIKQSDFF